MAPSDPVTVERWFSQAWYPPVQRFLTSASNLTPFAWLDALVILAVLWIGRVWIRAVRKRSESSRAGRVAHAAFLTATAGGVFYLAFLVLWGMHYRRLPLGSQLLLESAPPST